MGTAKKGSRILTKLMTKYNNDATKLLDGMGFHLISENYTEHIANMTRMFQAFENGPINLAGHMVDIRKVKLGLTNPKFDKHKAFRYNYSDDKIIFLVNKDGETIQLECMGMPKAMYLLKCESHKIYDFTRVFGQKSIIEGGLTAQSLDKIYESIKDNLLQDATLTVPFDSKICELPSSPMSESESDMSVTDDEDASLDESQLADRLLAFTRQHREKEHYKNKRYKDSKQLNRNEMDKLEGAEIAAKRASKIHQKAASILKDQNL